MEIMIDGKEFDTEGKKTIFIHNVEFRPFEAVDESGDAAIYFSQEDLYRSEKGQFFLVSTSSYSTHSLKKTSGRLLSTKDVGDWLVENEAPRDAYEAAGFEVEEG